MTKSQITMTKENNIGKIIGLGMLLFAIGFNLWLYRLELTATVDPNDNAFQYALVDRTNQIWDFASKKCSINVLCFTSYLVDHWVPNWAEGYNLPFYYSHIPQIIIIASWRFFNQISLFLYYHWVIYLLLSLFPLSVFIALRVIKLPWLAAGLGALLASHISTDGLYGLDPPSFLWRGYGLSSQLFGMVWMPLAIAYAWKFFNKNSRFWPAVFFLTMTAMGHLGLGMMALLSLIPIAMAKPLIHILHLEPVADIFEVTKNELTKLIALGGVVIFFLSYWIIPIFLMDNYHNFSFWDPPWKFASYGAKETITRLLNGDLFDWGRGPWMTVLVTVGLIAASYVLRPTSYVSFSLLFLFWLLMYFGRGTWGGFIDLIPGMKEFHLSRFIVGIHAAGLFLAPIGIWSLLEAIPQIPYRRLLRYLCVFGFLGIILPPIYKQTLKYAKHNDRLIKQANENYAKTKSDEDLLFAAIRSLPPGRVFAGRGGGWGKDFRVAETPYYMQLSTFGLPTTLWLPETWSPNSDVEQYFSEDKAKDYDLFGIRYVATPSREAGSGFARQPFWKLLKEAKTWKLYEIQKVGYFTTGIRATTVAVNKRSYVNAVRLWIQTDQTHARGLFPELTFAKDYPKTTGLPNFKMLDEVTYIVPDGSTHNIFTQPPLYLPPGMQSQEQFNKATTQQYNNATVLSESSESDMIYKAKIEVKDPCRECIVILKQSFHPNWRATIDGKPVQTLTVFPFYTAVFLPTILPGLTNTHEVVFSYEPSRLKITLLVLEVVMLAVLFMLAIKTRVTAKS